MKIKPLILAYVLLIVAEFMKDSALTSEHPQVYVLIIGLARLLQVIAFFGW